MKFNMRIQQEGESVENFITALYTLSETCNYGGLTNEMIRDRIVVGIRDDSVAERLQIDFKSYRFHIDFSRTTEYLHLLLTATHSTELVQHNHAVDY